VALCFVINARGARSAPADHLSISRPPAARMRALPREVGARMRGGAIVGAPHVACELIGAVQNQWVSSLPS